MFKIEYVPYGNRATCFTAEMKDLTDALTLAREMDESGKNRTIAILSRGAFTDNWNVWRLVKGKSAKSLQMQTQKAKA